jgi:hypothetical protein
VDSATTWLIFALALAQGASDRGIQIDEAALAAQPGELSPPLPSVPRDSVSILPWIGLSNLLILAADGQAMVRGGSRRSNTVKTVSIFVLCDLLFVPGD